jgi:dolichol kinase
MVHGAYAAALVAAPAGVGLWAANFVYDRGVSQYVSRKIGHFAGGASFIVATVLFTSPYIPIAISSVFALVFFAARRYKPRMFRGVGGSARRSIAEVWFALVAVPVFATGWLLGGRPELSLTCLLFMAWGDGASGLTRFFVYRRAVKGVWGSAAMFGTCFAISKFLIEPLLVGAAVSLVAVGTEWACGDVGVVRWADDNWAVPLASLGASLLLLAAAGKL